MREAATALKGRFDALNQATSRRMARIPDVDTTLITQAMVDYVISADGNGIAECCKLGRFVAVGQYPADAADIAAL